MPIFNDAKECLFKGDSAMLSCKEEINELVMCNDSPREYVKFLEAGLPEQREPKTYDFFRHRAPHDKYGT